MTSGVYERTEEQIQRLRDIAKEQKGKTYEERYGIKKAKRINKIRSSMFIGREITWSDKISEAHKGKKLTKEHRNNISKALTGRKLSEEHSKNISKALKGKRPLNLDSLHAMKVSSIEYAICAVLDGLGVKYIQQYQIDLMFVDIYLPKYKTVIECDGDYWHNLPDRKKKDRRRDLFLRNRGYKVIHIWEHAIRENPKKALKNAINNRIR